MLIVLMLSLTSLSKWEFKEVTFRCMDIKYTYTIEGSSNTYIRVKDEEYLTQFNEMDRLDKEVQRQCGKK